MSDDERVGCPGCRGSGCSSRTRSGNNIITFVCQVCNGRGTVDPGEVVLRMSVGTDNRLLLGVTRGGGVVLGDPLTREEAQSLAWSRDTVQNQMASLIGALASEVASLRVRVERMEPGGGSVRGRAPGVDDDT